MSYLRVPNQITLDEIRAKGSSLSAGMYRRVIIPTSQVKRVGDLIKEFENGVSVGSLSYVKSSQYRFIRTKALQDFGYLTQFKGDAVIYITPRAYLGATSRYPLRAIADGDILYARGGSVGEVAIADGCGNATISGHVMKIVFRSDYWYSFAFMKHPICKLQQQPNIKGAIAALDNFTKDTLLDCLIPFPNQSDANRVVQYVSVLAQALVEKEKAIREKNKAIDSAIEQELTQHQCNGAFIHSFPNIQEVRAVGRLDTGMYSEDFKRKQFIITNYQHGYATYEELGFEIGRGQNLQLSNIGKSIYSQVPKSNFYRLMAPTDISEYRTVRQFRYLGNKKNLDVLKQGDVVFGAEGFGKGRVVILADEVQGTISNIHGITFRHKHGEIIEGIFLGCFLGYLRNIGIVDAIGAGGSGGSLAIGYFHHVQFPKFPDHKKDAIARLYHNPTPPPADNPTLDTFVEWHRRWNQNLGIWELDREMKNLQQVLADVQEDIIEGKTVHVPI